jgi:dTDP-4-dehydrorhamnose 3,5-epimerase
MKIHKTPLRDARLIELDPTSDDRGFFARFFCEREFGAEGLARRFVQMNNSLSAKKGTLRGMHYQLPPSAEVKVIRCLKGVLWDCIADLRPDSASFGKWFGTELNDDNRLMMYVPRGFAHAILTLADDTEALYLVSDFYDAAAERGIRFDDPWLSVNWPIEPVEVSLKDRNWQFFNPKFHGIDQLRAIK